MTDRPDPTRPRLAPALRGFAWVVVLLGLGIWHGCAKRAASLRAAAADAPAHHRLSPDQMPRRVGLEWRWPEESP